MDPDFVIFLDGGVTANPGKIVVAAVVCTPNGEPIAESARTYGEGTSNVGEYRALRHAIHMANLAGARRPVFFSDSQLVVKQITGWWALKVGGELAKQHGYCSSALMEFDRWAIKHVPREQNKRADWLVCRELGHKRTLKKAPEVSRVEFDYEGRPGWAQLA